MANPTDLAHTAAGGGPDGASPARPRIFLIGQNKCGTTSFHRLFERCGIVSSHWVHEGRNLAVAMVNNMALGQHPFAGFEGVEAFTDLNHVERKLLYIEGARFFREIHAFEPDAYFILNTRNVDRWLESRVNHGLAEQVSVINNMSEAEVLDHWRSMFQRHHDEVRAYFKDNPRFLEFDIETGDINQVVSLLAPDYQIDPEAWGQHFATADKHLRPRQMQLDAETDREQAQTRLPKAAEVFIALVRGAGLKPKAFNQVRQLVRDNSTLFAMSNDSR